MIFYSGQLMKKFVLALGMRLRDQGLLLEEEDDADGFLELPWIEMMKGSSS